MDINALLKLLEYGATLTILILVLFGLYKLVEFGLKQYLDNLKEHNKEFLKEFNKLVESNIELSKSVIKGDNAHSEEHGAISTMLEIKTDDNHKQHLKMIELLEKTDANVNSNTKSIRILHDDIKSFHSNIV